MYFIFLGIVVCCGGCCAFTCESDKSKITMGLVLICYTINNLFALVFACIINIYVKDLNQIDFENLIKMMTSSNKCLDTFS